MLCKFGHLQAALSGGRPVQRLVLPLLLCQRSYAATGSGSVGSLFKSFRQRPHRNPRIIPHAKVKAYKVREWRERDPDMTSVYGEQFEHYVMQMEALKQAFYYELHGHLLLPGESAVAGLHRLGSREDHLADSAEAKRRLDEAARLNAEWNSRSAEQRAADMLRLLDEMRSRRDRLQLEAELSGKAAVLSFQERLKQDLAESADFIDESNMDAKIEAIIDSPIIDFNFAIDPAGNIVRGAGLPLPVVDPPAPPAPEELSVRV